MFSLCRFKFVGLRKQWGLFRLNPSRLSQSLVRTSVIYTLIHIHTIGHASKRPFARRYRSNDKRVRPAVVSAERERDKYVFAPSPNQLPTPGTAADVRLVSRENDGFSWNLTPVPPKNPHPLVDRSLRQYIVSSTFAAHAGVGLPRTGNFHFSGSSRSFRLEFTRTRLEPCDF